MMPFIVVGLFGTGLLIGYFFRNRNKFRHRIEFSITWAVYLLLFLLGITVGTQEKIINNFSKIGFEALILTVGAVFGSILLAYIVYRWLFVK